VTISPEKIILERRALRYTV